MPIIAAYSQQQGRD